MIPIYPRFAATVLLLAVAAWTAGCEQPPAEATPHTGAQATTTVQSSTRGPTAAPTQLPLATPIAAPASSPDEPPPLSTLVPTFVAFPTPDPSPTIPRWARTLGPGQGPSDTCGHMIYPFPGVGRSSSFVHWTKDGKRLVFDLARMIATVNAKGADSRIVADTDPGKRWTKPHWSYGYYADISPDGSRIVYATCEYRGENVDDYEIAIANVDGTDRFELTRNLNFDNYPVWSPDGVRIAFIATLEFFSYTPNHYDPFGSSIFTMSADGVAVVPGTKGVGLYPPVWSPDGGRLAFTANRGQETAGDGVSRPLERMLYTVRLDGSEFSRIGEATTLPTWSPDGRTSGVRTGRPGLLSPFRRHRSE